MHLRKPVKTTQRFSNLLIIALTLSSLIVTNASATQFYLEDADTTAAPAQSGAAPKITQHEWPRVMMAETQSLGGDLDRYAKYQMIASSAGSIDRVAILQRSYPDLMYMRQINPNEYLGYSNETANQECIQSHGNSFSKTSRRTGDTSGGGCGVYAGHWLYQAGTRSTNALTATSTSLRVQDASRFTNGHFIVIYNAPAGSFNNAEHAKIVGKNNSTNTLTLQRAFKSTGVPHAANSIVAQHALGQGNSVLNWAYNLSTQSPRDANNLRYNDFFPTWVKQNVSRNLIGDPTTVEVSGILFDVDFYFLLPQSKADVNNDLVTDDGISPNGINWWGEGVDQFYTGLRGRFPNLILSGGVNHARGFDTLNGTQLEGFPNLSDFRNSDPDYEDIAGQLNKYSYNANRRSTGPAHTHVLSKTPSRLYPVNGTRPANNRSFRLTLGLTLLEDGFFAFENSNEYQDLWFDEYSVDITAGSATYGQATNFATNTVAEVRANRGWLGRPTGPRKRIYSDSEFASQNAIFSGVFESNIDGWEGREVRIFRSTTAQNVRDGRGALRITGHVGGYEELLFEASAKGPITPVVKGRTYTYVFSSKASETREISVAVGGHTERFTIGPDWQRHVMTFTADKSVSLRPSFNVGRESTDVWIDTVHLFEGDANVFRRDFERGIVVVNATPKTITVPLGGTFQRIQGTQDGVNDGSRLSTVTLPPYDSALLVRLANQQPNSDTQPPSITINAPTKTKIGAITNTTIVVTDSLAVNASGIKVAAGNTAGVSNLNCTQTNSKQVRCTVTITSSGDLSLSADDVAGNRGLAKELDYFVNGGPTGDGERPHISFNAPTKTKAGAITNTTLSVTDNVQIFARDVIVRSESSAEVDNFNCVQSNSKLVRCTMRVVSSGDIKLKATDAGGNIHFVNIEGYRITSAPRDTTKPFLVISAPTKSGHQIIRDTIIEARDLVSIKASQIALRADNTVDTRGLKCSQINAGTVRCTIQILSSGDLKLRATDSAGNVANRNVNGYRITGRRHVIMEPIVDLLD